MDIWAKRHQNLDVFERFCDFMGGKLEIEKPGYPGYIFSEAKCSFGDFEIIYKPLVINERLLVFKKPERFFTFSTDFPEEKSLTFEPVKKNEIGVLKVGDDIKLRITKTERGYFVSVESKSDLGSALTASF